VGKLRTGFEPPLRVLVMQYSIGRLMEQEKEVEDMSVVVGATNCPALLRDYLSKSTHPNVGAPLLVMEGTHGYIPEEFVAACRRRLRPRVGVCRCACRWRQDGDTLSLC
jgi:hypothetical protein